MKKLWIDKGGMIGGIVGMAVSIVLMAVCIVLAVFMADIEDAFGGFVFSIVASAASLIVFVLFLTYFFIPSCYQLVFEDDQLSLVRFGKTHESYAYDQIYWIKFANGDKKCIKIIDKDNKNMKVELIFYYSERDIFEEHGVVEYPETYKVPRNFDSLKDK